MSSLNQVFCRAGNPPTLKQIMELLSEEGFDIHFDDQEEETDPDDPSWAEARIIYDDSEEAVVMELWREEESEEFEELRDEMLINLDEIGDKTAKRITTHLKKSQFVIQILGADLDEEGESLVTTLVSNIASDYKGLLYVEDEGFYDGDDLILEMD